MSEPLFNVILEGTVKSDRTRSEVVENLSRIFKRDRATVEKLLAGKPRKIRQEIDLQAAQKYCRIIEKAGAACRIDPVSTAEAVEVPAAAKETPHADSSPAEAPCPRCGYVPAGVDDVMIVRGDCPKCGLMVKRPREEEDTMMHAGVADSEAPQSLEEDPETYAAITSASVARRSLASIYTFGCFFAVYGCIVLLFILCFIPLTSVPRHIALDFLVTAHTVAPFLMAALSILVVALFVPLFNEGRSWGQRALGIEILYTAEAQTSGLAWSLAFRVGAMLLLTLTPGLVVLWSVPGELLARGPWVEPLILAATAFVGWSCSWLTCLISPSGRSLLDRAGGTVQTEIGVMPHHAVRKGLGPVLLVLVVVCILGVIAYVFR